MPEQKFESYRCKDCRHVEESCKSIVKCSMCGSKKIFKTQNVFRNFYLCVNDNTQEFYVNDEHHTHDEEFNPCTYFHMSLREFNQIIGMLLNTGYKLISNPFYS